MDWYTVKCVVVTFIITAIIATASIYILEKIQCSAKATALEYKCSYSFWQGCVLEKPNGKKVLLEQLRDFGDK